MKTLPLIIVILLSIMVTACQTTHTMPMTKSQNTNLELSQAVTPPAFVTNTYAVPQNGNDMIGNIYKVAIRKGDTLSEIANHYDVGMAEIKAANPGISAKKLRIGQTILIPKQYILPPPQYRKGIVINIPEARIYYFTSDGQQVKTFPVALGREGWRTPVGKTWVIKKEKDPVWNVPESIRLASKEKGKILPRQVQAGPDNPLGHYAIYLGFAGYLIHGTNDPSSIGKLVSSGCIRMHNRDVEQLFQLVDRGTPVRIIHYPNKVGWENGQLYLESHKPITDEKGIYEKDAITVADAIASAFKEEQKTNVDQTLIDQALQKQSGIPVKISENKIQQHGIEAL